MNIYRCCHNLIAKYAKLPCIGEVEQLQIIHDGYGHQYTIIDGVEYATWVNLIELPILKGCVIVHKPYIENAFGEDMIATEILKILRYPTIPKDYPYCK